MDVITTSNASVASLEQDVMAGRALMPLTFDDQPASAITTPQVSQRRESFGSHI
jgi:hypothetical protein